MDPTVVKFAIKAFKREPFTRDQFADEFYKDTLSEMKKPLSSEQKADLKVRVDQIVDDDMWPMIQAVKDIFQKIHTKEAYLALKSDPMFKEGAGKELYELYGQTMGW